MKNDNLQTGGAPGADRIRGRTSPTRAAGTGLVSVTDGTTEVSPTHEIRVQGAQVTDLDDGIAQIAFSLTGSMTNGDVVDFSPGDVVVIDTASGTIVATTTARDIRPVGVVQDYIAAGYAGNVLFAGFATLVNVVASVTAGDYGETSATAGDAQGSGTTRESGSFCVFTSTGTTPSAYLWGMTDGTATAASGAFETTTKGGGSVTSAHGNMGATETFDPATANVHTGTLNANCTFTLTAPASATVACTLEIRTTQDGTGARTITWPGSVSFIGGTPIINTTAGTTTVYIIETLDGGTTWIAAAVGSGLSTSSFATPSIVLGTAAAAGSATTVIRSDATILAFDATVPAAVGTAATGSQAVAARRDHVHATGAGTPTTQALGDAAATGTGPAAAMTDHKHAMPALSSATPLVEAGSGTVGTALPSSREDHVHPASAGGHAHVAGETHLSDGSTGLYTLDDYYEPETVIAFNQTTIALLTVTETLPDQATVSPVGASGDKIVFQYAATLV